MADLPTNLKDDILDSSVNTRRKYNMIENPDGTVEFEDVTEYSQVGDEYGAGLINETNKQVNARVEKAVVVRDLDTIGAITQPGFIPDALALKDVNDSLVSDIYVGEDGKLHKVQGGADSVLPFSSGGDYLKIAVGKASVDSGGSTTISIPENFTSARIFYVKHDNTRVNGLYQYEDGKLTTITGGGSYVSVTVSGRTITCSQSLTNGIVFGCLYE